MAPMVELHEVVAVVNWVRWLLLFGLSVVVLVYVSNYFTGESPQTLFKAVRTTLVLWGTVYLAYDLSGYLFALLMQDPVNGIRMPAHYSYWDWFREPFALKWYVLGFVPIIRFLPIVFGLCAGSVLLVFLLDVPYHIALVVFLGQLFLDMVALVVLSFGFNAGIGVYVRNVVEPALMRQQEEAIREAVDRREAPATLRHLHHRIQNLEPGQGPPTRQVETRWQLFNSNFLPVYSLLRPLTRHLPVPAQAFLDAGGWLLAIPGLVALTFAWPRIHRGRTRLHHRRRKRRAGVGSKPRVLLAEIGDALTGLGEKQITVGGIPGRVRLVVFSPAAPGVVPPPDGSHAQLLDAALSGLSQVAATDFPKAECWTDPRARDNFRQAVWDGVRVPESPDELSRWVVLVGDVAVPHGRYHLALALRSESPVAARFIVVPAGRWSESAGVREVPIEDRGL